MKKQLADEAYEKRAALVDMSKFDTSNLGSKISLTEEVLASRAAA